MSPSYWSNEIMFCVMIYFQKYVACMIIRAYTIECGEVQVAPPLARKDTMVNHHPDWWDRLARRRRCYPSTTNTLEAQLFGGKSAWISETNCDGKTQMLTRWNVVWCHRSLDVGPWQIRCFCLYKFRSSAKYENNINTILWHDIRTKTKFLLFSTKTAYTTTICYFNMS